MMAAEHIAEFAHAARQLPDAVSDAARWHFLDAIGVGLAASTVAETANWRGVAASAGPATVLGGGSAAPAEAALVNGSLIHSLEYDDTHIASVVHGSAVTAPAALAAAEAAGASGAELLSAYAVAWEVMIAVGLAAPGAFQARGFQVTAVAGALGAAAAAARLTGLSRAQTVSALGIAGSQASGLLAFLSDGSSAKALNPGWAAHTGLTAAALARAGMTGPADILEGRYGVMRAFAGLEPPAGFMTDLGRRWRLPDASYKLYPCCHYIHSFLEALRSVVDDEGVCPDDVRHILAHVPAEEAPLVCEPWERRQAPVSGYDGKWGLAYCLGLLLVDGRVDVASFEHPPRPEVIAVARRIDWRPVTESGFPARFPARLDVTLSDGRMVTSEIANVMGSPDRPVASDRILDKFMSNAGRALGQGRARALADSLLGLDEARDLSGVRAALGR